MILTAVTPYVVGHLKPKVEKNKMVIDSLKSELAAIVSELNFCHLPSNAGTDLMIRMPWDSFLALSRKA